MIKKHKINQDDTAPDDVKPEDVNVNRRPEDPYVEVKYKVVVTVWDSNGNITKQFEKFFQTRTKAENYKRVLKLQYDRRHIISSIEIVKIDQNKSVSKVHSKRFNSWKREVESMNKKRWR